MANQQNTLLSVERAAIRLAEELGYEWIDLELVKEPVGRFLRFYIDKEGGVGIDECEKFSNAFGEIFDRLDPIKEEYILEVSSPGVDRVLKTQREFDYFSGREVSVKLYAALNGKKEFDGILKGLENETVTVEINNEEVSFKKKEAAFVRLAFKI